MKHNPFHVRQLSPCSLGAGQGVQIGGCKGSNKGGQKAFFLAAFSSTGTTFSINASNVITAVTGPTFVRIDCQKTPSKSNSTPKGNDENGTLYYEGNNTIVINKFTPTLRELVSNIAQMTLHIIEWDANNYLWLHGKVDGCDVSDGSDILSGAKRDDPNRVILSYNSYENDPKWSVSATTSFTWTY